MYFVTGAIVEIIKDDKEKNCGRAKILWQHNEPTLFSNMSDAKVAEQKIKNGLAKAVPWFEEDPHVNYENVRIWTFIRDVEEV